MAISLYFCVLNNMVKVWSSENILTQYVVYRLYATLCNNCFELRYHFRNSASVKIKKFVPSIRVAWIRICVKANTLGSLNFNVKCYNTLLLDKYKDIALWSIILPDSVPSSLITVISNFYILITYLSKHLINQLKMQNMYIRRNYQVFQD